MDIAYYYDDELQYCPVKKYLEQYSVVETDKDSVSMRKQKIFANIDSKIRYVANSHGRPVPSIAKPLHGYSFFEILNPKDSNTVIRILYFRHEDKIILLHVFEKPASYKTDKEKKAVDKEYQVADKYLKIFKINPKKYEKYN